MELALLRLKARQRAFWGLGTSGRGILHETQRRSLLGTSMRADLGLGAGRYLSFKSPVSGRQPLRAQNWLFPVTWDKSTGRQSWL